MFLLLVAVFCCTTTSAQLCSQTTTPSTTGVLPLPDYAYCEIICSHLPSYKGDGVLFDFGQKTDAMSYNWLKDAKGSKLIFNSSIEALNYMVRQGWEFVQAYTSGEENKSTHYLLRIPTSHLTEVQKMDLMDKP